MVLLATVGHPQANSFVSSEELNEFMNANDLDWVNVPESEAERLAIFVSSKISAVKYLGQPLYSSQRLAFPRKFDARVQMRPFTDVNLVPVEAGTQAEDCVANYTSVGTEFSTVNFPVPESKSGVAILVTIVVSGANVTLVDVGDGVLSGGWVMGSIDHEKGTFKVDADVDSGTVGRIEGAWYYGDRVASQSLQYDTQEYEPDFLVTGSVHIPRSDGYRDYLDIVAHNIVSGELKLSGRMSSLDIADALVFRPHLQNLKKAQFVQILAERKLYDWDKNANRGISRIKIGDTAMAYDAGRIPNKGRQLAGQYRVHEAVFALLAPYSIYGKMGVIFGEWNSSPAEQ